MKNVKRLNLNLSLKLTLLLLLGGCALTGRITKSHTVRIDTVRVPVQLPEHTFAKRFELQDSLFFEDSLLSLSLRRVQPIAANSDTLHDKKEIAPYKPNLWAFKATVKPETVRVKVPQKTITDHTETTKYVKRTQDL